MSGTRRRIDALVVLLLLAGCLLASCASEPGGPHETAGRTVARDARLFGIWRVATVDIVGHPRLTADTSATASLRFRPDGVLIVNGSRCGAPRFVTATHHLKFRWQASTDCAYYSAGSRVDLRIAETLDRLISNQPLSYAIRGKTLTLAAVHNYRVVLLRGHRPQPRPSIGSSSFAPYSGPSTTGASSGTEAT